MAVYCFDESVCAPAPARARELERTGLNRTIAREWSHDEVERALTIMLDVEQPLYEATTLLNAAGLLRRCAESC